MASAWHRATSAPPQANAAPAATTIARALAGTLLCAAALVLAARPAHATTYKWVDENGVTHYTDKIPAEQVNKARVELDKQARPVKKVDPPPTPEQAKARQDELERQQAETREREAMARRDRALMASFTSEDEIDLARNRVLATIDDQARAAQSYLQQLQKREAELQAKKKTLGDKPLPVADERELDALQTELAKQRSLIALKQREREATNAKYDADKARWRELRAMADAGRTVEAARNTSAEAAPKRTSATVR